MLRKSLVATIGLSALSILACSAGGTPSGSGVSTGSGAATGSGANGTGAGINVGSGNTGNGTGTGGDGINVGPGDTGGSGGGGNSEMQCDGKFKGYLRDFTIAPPNGPDPAKWWSPGAKAPVAETVGGVAYAISPDFEIVENDTTGTKQYVADPGMVLPALGADQTPQYAGPANGTITTTGPANFATWFHDTAGVNLGGELDLQFDKDPKNPTDPNAYTFSSGMTGSACTGPTKMYCAGFYPIDGLALGNEGNNHNYHMTFELHLKFKYHAGQVFNFTGDDDVWVFIDNKLAVDLGGIHTNTPAPLSLDPLGLTEGSVYNLDFFWCERHITQSNFHIDTSLEVVDCGTVVIK